MNSTSKLHSSNYDLNNHLSLKISKILISIVIIFIFFQFLITLFNYQIYENGTTQIIKKILNNYFNLDAEHNITSWFSTILLASAGISLFIIRHIETTLSLKKYWTILGITFFYLSIDENISLHERSNDMTKQIFESYNIKLQGIFYFSWVIPASICVVVLFILLIPFLLNINSKIRNIFIFSGFIFILGAVVCESICAYAHVNSMYLLYECIMPLEEALEMLGVIFFLHGLTTCIITKYDSI